MIDFNANNGDWQKYNFDRIVADYSRYVDNWIIGNEINSQLYNFYGAASIRDYTKVYCDSFKICYDKIKAKIRMQTFTFHLIKDGMCQLMMKEIEGLIRWLVSIGII